MAKIRARFLADTSAWFWAAAAESRWRELLSSGQIATCPIVEIEYLYSAPSSGEYEGWCHERESLEIAPLNETASARALEAQGLLAKKQELGHRSVKLPDLLVAACAEQAGLTVLHYDRDFERIAAVTGQPCEWLAPRGSLSR